MDKSTLLNNKIKKYACNEIEDIFCDLNTTSNGLGFEQLLYMKKKFGANDTLEKKSDTILHRIRRSFINPFTIILFVLAVVSFITDILLNNNSAKNYTTVAIISIMILLSGGVRLIQEIRSKKALEKLDQFINKKVSVKRDGIIVSVHVEELVVGDYVIISAGERIPADLRIVESLDLFISQAAITGESTIIEKSSSKHEYSEQISFSQLKNIAYMGTTVISGRGAGIVVAVGKDTLYSNFNKGNSRISNSFEKGANSIAIVLIKFMVILIPIVFVFSGMTKGNWGEAFLFALSVAVGLTPEMLPMIITACLAKGSISMAKKQTVIKDINAMQGFGSMDVLCMDKTGTLTNENILLEYFIDVLGNECSDVLDLGYLNSLYHSGIKNPIDNAILKCHDMSKNQTYFDDLANKHKKIDEIPFDYNRKFVSTLVTDGNYRNTLIAKGDIDEIFSRCSFIEHQGELIPIENNGISSVYEIVGEMLEDGMKVVAVAKKLIRNKDTVYFDDESNMILMGYLVFFDTPKKSAVQSISKLKELHVGTKILTGDKLQIAMSICRRVGISSENILSGFNINDMSDLDLQLAVEKTSVFAELTPNQKVRIISALRENGHSVGFLGDGINDIPAICEADVGISVDTAVDAAKNIADVILLEKDLNVLNDGILEGRKTFTNMSKYIKITASSNFGNIFSIVCASAFLPFLPITSIQILFLNLLYDIICMVLPWDYVDEEEYSRPREWSGKRLSKFMIYFGSISSVFDIITFLFLYFVLCPYFCGGMLFTELTDITVQTKYIAIFQTGWFLESMWTQVLIIHMLRTKKTSFVKSNSSPYVLGITILGILVFTWLTFTDTAQLFGMTILPTWYFGFLAIVVLLYMLSTTIVKILYIKKYHELI